MQRILTQIHLGSNIDISKKNQKDTWDSFICMWANTWRKPTTASHSLLCARLCWLPVHGPYCLSKKQKTNKQQKNPEFICMEYNINRKIRQTVHSLGLSFRNCYEKLNIYRITYLITPPTVNNIFNQLTIAPGICQICIH